MEPDFGSRISGNKREKEREEAVNFNDLYNKHIRNLGDAVTDSYQ
jgi:hypothetical protein